MISLEVDKAGQAALVSIESVLRDYPQVSKRAIGKALRSKGYRLSREMRAAIDKGGASTAKWPGLNVQAKWFKRARQRGHVKNWRAVRRGRRKQWVGREYWSERFLKTVAAGAARRAQTGQPFARFKGGIRYKYEKDKLEMQVGFVNPSFKFQALLEKHATGFRTPISDKARRFAFAMGLPLSKSKHFFHVPARPLVGPVWRQEEAQSLRNIEQSFLGFDFFDENN